MPASTTIRMSARPGSTQVSVAAGVASVAGAAYSAAGTSVKPAPGAVAIAGAAGAASAIVKPKGGLVTVTAAAYLAGPSVAATVYGSGLNADTLANTNLDVHSSSSRLRATKASPINTVRQYFITGHGGYFGGNGGIIRGSIQRDNGSGFPDGTILASATVSPGSVDPSATIGSGIFTLTFASPYTPTAGELLHVVYDNVDASPTVNYCAHDNLFARGATISPICPRLPDAAVLMKTSGSWAVRDNFTPIVQFGYADGTFDGIGHMEFSPSNYGTISGTSFVSQLFTPSSTLTVWGYRLRILRASGTDDLTVSLRTSAGAAIDTVSVPYTAIAVGTATGGDVSHGETQLAGMFSAPRTITGGSSYRLWLSCPSSSTYNIFVIRKGVSYGFDSSTFFGSSNRAQASSNSGSTWSDSIGRVSGENDLNGFGLIVS